eukprot:SAG31_NODE_1391_length_8535_cov_11.998696_3_plen_331_part_00
MQDELPRMGRDDPESWFVTEAEAERFAKAPGEPDPYFSAQPGRIYLKNGAEQDYLDSLVRPLFPIAEQLMGAGTVVWPAGIDEHGQTTGPCFLNDDSVEGLGTHHGKSDHGGISIHDRATADGFDWDGKTKPWQWEPKLTLPPTGPVWLNAQGGRGLYVTLPGSVPHKPPYPAAHSDGACYGNVRLQMMAYLEDVPADGGAFTVWRGSHARIWTKQWEAFQKGETHTKSRLGKSPKQNAPGFAEIEQIKQDTLPFDTHAPAGSVVLWHTKILHMAGHNLTTDSMRIGAIYGFAKTPEALAAEEAVRPKTIWEDWALAVRVPDADCHCARM